MNPLMIASAVMAARSMTQRPPINPVQAKSYSVNTPQQGQSALSKAMSIASVAKDIPKNENIPTNTYQDKIAPTEQSTENLKTAYNPMQSRLDSKELLSSHEQTLNTFRNAEIQLNNLPPQLRQQYYEPFAQTVMRYHQDYNQGRIV